MRWSGGVPALNMKIKVDLMEEVIWKHEPEACEGNNQKAMWGKSIPGRGNSKSQP